MMIRAFYFAWSHWEIAVAVTLLVVLHYLWTVRTELHAFVFLRSGESALKGKDYDKAFRIAGRLLKRGADAASDDATRESQAAAHCLRGSVHVRRNEDDQALAAFDAAIDLAPELEEAYVRRAAIYRKAGRLDDALADYQTVIDQTPTHARVYIARAAALCVEARHEEAAADCDMALRLAPRDPGIHRQIGLVRICAGQFDHAAVTLARAVTLDPKNAYAALLLHLARAGAGQEDARELRDNAAGIDRRAWPGPLLALYLGEITADQVLAAARSDETTARERLGEAAFYRGERALLAGDTAEAERLLREAQLLCPAPFIESWAAATELRRLCPPAVDSEGFGLGVVPMR
jgi:lipoprotein NlpI